MPLFWDGKEPGLAEGMEAPLESFVPWLWLLHGEVINSSGNPEVPSPREQLHPGWLLLG